MKFPKILSTFLIIYTILIVAKLFIYGYNSELLIVSSNIREIIANSSYILREDVIIGIVLILLATISYTAIQKSRVVISTLYILLFAVDIWLYHIFLSRLAPSDYVMFLTKDTIIQFIQYTWILLISLGVIGLLIYSIYRWGTKLIPKKYLLVSISTLFISIFIIGYLAPDKTILYPYKTNTITLQIQKRKPQSMTLGSQTKTKTYQDYAIQIQSKQQNKNIIVLFAESRSAIDSIRAGGLYNHLSNFDKIQKDGITFTNFFAHGCTSDASHIAFLQGTEPRISTLNGGAYEKYKNYRGYLPAYFQNNGYNTQFFSTVSLDFLDQRSYIQKLGFDAIRGEEYFAEFPKYVFDAASDTQLYKKTITQLQNTDKPLFFTLQNVSGHHPYNTPYGNTFQDAMRYSDASFAEFYATLQENNFFDDGYLIVFSDHRKIAPLTKEEFQHFGRSAYNRGVATIIGPDIPVGTVVDTPLQHVDFYHGLKLLIGDDTIKLPSIFNDPFGNYQGRDRSVRYCQYADPRYYITEQDGTTNVWTESDNTDAKDYIIAYEQRHNQETSITQNPQTIPDIVEENNITLVAHQGSPANQPANSVVAMREAAQRGAKGVEFDVSRTTDGYHVVVHGPDMGSIQCKNIQKPYIYNYSFAELRADCTLSNGDAILTLSEMLEKLEGLFDYVFVDIKVYEENNAIAQAQDIIAVLDQFDRKQDIHPIAYDKTVANYLLDYTDRMSIGRDSYDFDLPNIHDSGIQSYLLGLQFIDQINYPAIQNSSTPVFAYTVRSYEDMKKVLDSGIRNILVTNIDDAIVYIQQYYNTF